LPAAPPGSHHFELANPGEGFKRYFEVMPTLTDELRDHVYRIRHEVYCAELEYEPVRPDGREPKRFSPASGPSAVALCLQSQR